MTIEALWQEHREQSFPVACEGLTLGGFDLSVLVEHTTDCVGVYLRDGGELGCRRTAMLGICYRALSVAALSLEGEAQAYFVRLEKLARLMLEILMRTA